MDTDPTSNHGENESRIASLDLNSVELCFPFSLLRGKIRSG